MKTLEQFLKHHNACSDGYKFAKDLTLEQFLSTCQRGDWILWLFAKTNPSSIREITLAAGHCANTVRHLMEDYYADASAAAYAAYARKENQKATADICRKYLPLEIWNQSKI